MKAAMKTGLALKLAVFILAGITALFACVFAYNYSFSRRIIVKNIEERAHHLALATVNRIDILLTSLKKVPETLALFLETSPCGEAELGKIMKSSVVFNPEIYGTAVAFEPNAFQKETRNFAPYSYREGEDIAHIQIPYDYFTWDWYRIPKEIGRPDWTEPYYDEGAGNIIMATYSVPFYRAVNGQRTFTGVVTADVSLSWLRDIVSSIKIGETGYGFLISSNGTFITHPEERLVMHETIFSVAEARGDKAMRELGRRMIAGESGFAPFTSILTGKNCWLVYAPLASCGWSLGVLFPRDELMSDITSLNHTVFALSLAGFFVLLVLIVGIARTITRPLRALTQTASDIATGNLDIEIPAGRSRDEVGRLAESFEHMRQSLKEHIRELTETTALNERIESELKIASDIQMGLLPKTFPPFPEHDEFEVFAFLAPAKEVGGDLYDFFFVDDVHFCFTIGDVSGKGVPAALFMVIARTLIKTKAAMGLGPEDVLRQVNRDLCRDNPSLMFVTLFMGILNVQTGEVVYSSGGHNLPYLISEKKGVLQVKKTEGMALGIVEDGRFDSKKIVLDRGDGLFLYTDGVTEATNIKDEAFTEERLAGGLLGLKDRPIQDIITGIMERTREFAAGAPQSDDITMMMLRFIGGGAHG